MEELQKLEEKRKVGKVRGYMGARVFFWGKEKDVYINKGTRYRKQIGSWGRQKKDLKKEDIFLRLGEKIWRMDFHKT